MQHASEMWFPCSSDPINHWPDYCLTEVTEGRVNPFLWGGGVLVSGGQGCSCRQEGFRCPSPCDSSVYASAFCSGQLGKQLLELKASWYRVQEGFGCWAKHITLSSSSSLPRRRLKPFEVSSPRSARLCYALQTPLFLPVTSQAAACSMPNT